LFLIPAQPFAPFFCPEGHAQFSLNVQFALQPAGRLGADESIRPPKIALLVNKTLERNFMMETYFVDM